MKQLNEKEIQLYEDWSKKLIVTSPEHRTRVMEALKEVKTKKAEIVAFFQDSKEKAHAAWKAIVANEKRFTDKLSAFEEVAKNAIKNYDAELEKQRAAEQKRLEAEAQAQADAERKSILEQAKKARGAEKKELLKQADNVVTAMVSAPVTVEKTEGESTRKIWKARVIDFAKLPDAFKLPNEKALNAMATTTKGPSNIPGVEFYTESVLSVRI